MNYLKYILLVALTLPWNSFAQEDDKLIYAKQISEENLKKNVVALCAQDMQGRETGTQGQKRAASYIYQQFKKTGLLAINKSTDSLSYFQHFNLHKLKRPSGKIKINNKSFFNYKDYIANPVQDSVFCDTEVVFIGNSPIENYSDIDFSNKAICFTTANFNRAFHKAYKIYKHAKPKLILFIDPIHQEYYNRYLKISKQIQNHRFILKDPNNVSENKVSDFHKCLKETPIFPISVRLARKITGLKLRELKQLTLNKTKGILIKSNLSFSLKNEAHIIGTENVVALLEGSEKPEEFIVISAHYDHLGTKNGQVFVGANDNASGTSALIEIAKSFMQAYKEGFRPKRSLLFIGFSAEEKGLLGSEFFLNNSPVLISSIKSNLNIDMLGRRDSYHQQSNYVYLLGASHLKPQLKKTSDSLNALYTNLMLDYSYDQTHNPMYGASDQTSFVDKGIPAIMYFNGLHKDYHTIHDTVDKLDFKSIKQVSQLIFLTAWELANEN